MTSHHYLVRLHWDGATGADPRSYSRDHTAVAPPAPTEVALSADPSFHGSPQRLNPEQLVVMATSSCQMLSFLGAAARAGVRVLAYDDEATSRLDLAAESPRLAAIHLAVVVRTDGATAPDRVRELARHAHQQCFVANSLGIPVTLELTVDAP